MQPVDSKRGAVGPAAHRSSLNPRGCMSRAKFQSSRDQVLRQPLIVAGPRRRAIIGYESYRVVRRYAIHISYTHQMRA